MSAISSAIIDLPLVTVLASTERQIASTAARASAASRTNAPVPPDADDLLLVELEVEVEMRERVVLDRPALVAQRLELGQPLDRLRALRGKAGAGEAERALQIVVRRARLGRCALKAWLVGCISRYLGAPIGGDVAGHVGQHLGDVAHLDPRGRARDSLPAMLSRQPRSPAKQRVGAGRGDVGGLVASTILSEISGYLTQNVPPKPQHDLGARQFRQRQARRPMRAAAAAAP